jgi:hypothetical protein
VSWKQDREIERLRQEIAEPSRTKAVRWLQDRDRVVAENERLTRERDEAIKYRDDEFQLRDALSNENTRLRAALERIAAGGEWGIDGLAQDIARAALGGRSQAGPAPRGGGEA